MDSGMGCGRRIRESISGAHTPRKDIRGAAGRFAQRLKAWGQIPILSPSKTTGRGFYRGRRTDRRELPPPSRGAARSDRQLAMDVIGAEGCCTYILIQSL